MKEHVLSAGDRAALQGLIALAGTLGVGALLARLMPARDDAPDRHLGFVVFELFSVVAILTAAAITTYASIWFRHENEAISSGDLARVGAPLILSLVVLVLLVAVGRPREHARLAGHHLPSLLAMLTMAAALGISLIFLELEPEGIVAAATALLVIGGCLSWSYARIERFGMGRRRRSAFKRVGGLAAAGYLPSMAGAQTGLPTVIGESGGLIVSVWKKGEGVFLDQDSARHWEAEVNRRWTELTTGNAIAPVTTVC